MLRSVVLIREFCPPGDMGQWLVAFLAVTTKETGVTGIRWVEARDAVKPPTAQDSSTTKS